MFIQMFLSVKTSQGTIPSRVRTTISAHLFSSSVEALNHGVGHAVIFPVPIKI
jgi:hypothetical protein